MKAVSKLELEDNFDEAVRIHMDVLTSSRPNHHDIETHKQELINLIRVRVHRAFKIGLQEGAKK